MNKHILSALFVMFLSVNLFAQVQEHFNYQCALRDANGEILANTGVTVRFTFLNANGEAVAYQEKHSTTTNEFGLVNLKIGTGNVTQFSWNNLDWWGFEYLLQVEVDLGDGFVDMGTSEFGSVPFAVLSEKAVNMNLGDLNDVETFMGVNEGDVLRFNADENYWEPQPLPSIADGVWDSNETNAWRIGGNVGIGTDNPVYGLHLHNKQGLHLTTTATGTSFLDGFYLGQENDATVTMVNFENGPITFSTNFAERMRITENGLIGIGTTTPQTGLHLHNKNGMRLTKSFTGNSLFDGFFIGQDAFNNGNVYLTNYENADIIFNTNLTERLRLSDNGTEVNGNIEVSGYTQLGDAEDAPRIKMKKYSVTLDASNGYEVNVPLGIAVEKILSIDYIGYVFPFANDLGDQGDFYYSTSYGSGVTFVQVGSDGIMTVHECAGSIFGVCLDDDYQYDTLVKITIMYEE